MIAIDLSKQQALDAYPNTIQKINFTGNLNRQNADSQNINVNTTLLFITERTKETILDFSEGTVKILLMCSTISFVLI